MCTHRRLRSACPSAQSDQSSMGALLTAKGQKFLQLRIEIHILSLHWMMKNISYFNVCEARTLTLSKGLMILGLYPSILDNANG